MAAEPIRLAPRAAPPTGTLARGSRSAAVSALLGHSAPIIQTVTDSPAETPPPLSPRMAVAVARTRDRRERWGARMRPLLWVVVISLAVASLRGRPAPGWSGAGLAVTFVLAGCIVPMIAAAAKRWPLETEVQCAALSVCIGGFGIALAALQVNGVATLPVSAAVMTAFMFLEPKLAGLIAGVELGGLFAAILLQPDASLTNAVTLALFCAVLGVMAWSMRQAGRASDRAELLLAQLEDAREAEAQAVALAERTRIAQELHDVLAQSLSGLAIQMEAARRLARRPEVDDNLRELIDRSGKLVKEGLADARRAVGALRGDEVPTVDRLPELVERYRCDLELDVALTVTGTRRDLPIDAGFALYRGAQEALTNAARYARGSKTQVTLRYDKDVTVLTVEDRRTGSAPVPAPVATGSGLGLTGMSERIAAVGGTATAGPTERGWLVRMEISA
jgi:signal transduction histidine kinase